MSRIYAATSVLAGAYLCDVPGHAALRQRLLESDEIVLTSRVTSLEFASAIYGAHRADRVRRPEAFLAHFDAQCDPAGPIALVELQPSEVLPLARDLVVDHGLSALDAVHVATALVDDDGDLVFVTRDKAQARAARAAGLTVE